MSPSKQPPPREQNIAHLQSVQRDLLQRALEMRCLSYLADAKSSLLIRTVSRVGASKRMVLEHNRNLKETLEELKREIEARERVQRRLQAITEAVDHASLMVLVHRRGQTVHANRAFRRVFGSPPEAKTPFELLVALTHANASALPKSDAELPYSDEVEVTTTKGNLWLRVHLSQSAPERGESAYILSLEDVTEERETRGRTAQAHRLEALGQMVGGVAHDFNNVLMMLSSQLELLKYAPADQHADRIDAALSTVFRTGQITAKLLAFARKQSLETSRTYVAQLTNESLTMLRHTLGESYSLSVKNSLEPTATVLCDAGQLEAALVNLVVNARDASPVGSPIVIEWARAEYTKPKACGPSVLTPGRYLTMTVSDHGKGIPPELIDRIWEPFVSTKQEGEHSGLGLSMVLGFANQSGGGVEIAPQAEGPGTRMTLYLPEAQ